jgi:hypothetical protein
MRRRPNRPRPPSARPATGHEPAGPPRLQKILADLEVPAWFDYWGHDVNHDWQWWRLQMPYFLEKMDL